MSRGTKYVLLPSIYRYGLSCHPDYNPHYPGQERAYVHCCMFPLGDPRTSSGWRTDCSVAIRLDVEALFRDVANIYKPINKTALYTSITCPFWHFYFSAKQRREPANDISRGVQTPSLSGSTTRP